MAELKPGLRLKSAVCAAEVMIVKSPGEADLRCGGAPMLGMDETAGDATATADQMAGCMVGKRYVDEAQSIEVLCIKAGDGSLAVGDAALAVKQAKKLPSSD